MIPGGATDPPAARVGAIVSHYRVVRAIGSGGMGDVFEAEDLNLGRRIALKFIAASHERSEAAVQRLEREARAASALNHPHICTIFDIGQHAGERFIAMELLEGETLRDRLRGGPLDPARALEVGIHIASALDAAHRARLVHRDVTPSNVFLTRAGAAKLLDFGLSRHEPGQEGSAADDVSTTSTEPALTSPGTIVGTIAYMSPEQVRGETVDHRTDIFSFGAVLHESVTARRPFSGKTTALVFDAILHAAPERIATLNPAAPAGLQPVLDKALEKDRTRRYQHADELRADLQRIQGNLDGGPPPVSPWPRSRHLAVLAAGLAVTLAAAAVYFSGSSSRGVPDIVPREVTSSRGPDGNPAIAPDSQTIAYSSDESGNEDLWLTDVSGGPARRLTTAPTNEGTPSWFPDGKSLAFVSDRGGRLGIWRAPILDGESASLMIADGWDPAVSPDGHAIAFARQGPAGYTRVVVAPLANLTNQRTLTVTGSGRWDHQEPAWSPDGRWICYSAWDGLWVVPAAGGSARQLTKDEFNRHPAWSPGGQFVYFTARNTLWRVPAAGGAPRRMTIGSGSEVSPDVSKDGRLIAFASSEADSDLVIIDRTTDQQTVFGTGRNDQLPSFDSAHRIVYFVSNCWGTFDIWRMQLPDSGPPGPPQRAFAQDGVKSTHPAVSPDGRFLAYYRRAIEGRLDVWVIDLEKGSPASITTDGSSYHPAWSPDGRELAYVSERDGFPQIWIQPIADGRATSPASRLTTEPGLRLVLPAWSPDGTTLAFTTTTPSGHTEVAVVRRSGGRPAIVTSGADAMRAKWLAGSGTLAVSGRWGSSEYRIRTIDVRGRLVSGREIPLGTDRESAVFDVSADGKYVVTARGREQGHVWILEGPENTF